MRVVVALGGNALLRRGAPMTVAGQRAAIAAAAEPLARLVPDHELVVSHGNGPQVGLLALQAASYDHVSEYPFDVLGAQTGGMIGYLLESELSNHLGDRTPVAVLITRTLVDPGDPAFADPTKFVGPTYTRVQADHVAQEHGWQVKPDGDVFRRVVPSPAPVRILELDPIRWILGHGGVVVCSGGGGIPTARDPNGAYVGVEAVVDKDLASAVLARDLQADTVIIATDVDGVYLDWGTPQSRRIRHAHPDDLALHDFAEGSMGPKVAAAIQFAQETGGRAMIGSLDDLDGLVAGTSGTEVSTARPGLQVDARDQGPTDQVTFGRGDQPATGRR
jgi:carbamate kinase